MHLLHVDYITKNNMVLQAQKMHLCCYRTIMRLRSVPPFIIRFGAKTGKGMKTEKVPWDVGRR